MTTMAKKKKKGRPSLLELQKRSLKQQHPQVTKPNSLNWSRRSNHRNPNLDEASPVTDLIAGDDDDERLEKKHKLLLGFNSTLFNSVPYSSDSNANGDDPDIAFKRRKISIFPHGSDEMGQKVQIATDNSIHGLQVASGPTSPLPDKKLLVFILDRLQKKDTYGVFSEPVDPEELPDYHEIIENPMDFGSVRKKLDGGAYTNLEQFENDILLICSNAMEYNASDTIYYRQAKSMQELARKDLGNLRQDSDDGEPQPKIPKIVRRGRPPGKKNKKLIDSSPVERIGPESISDATLASGGENTNGYNLRRGPNSNKLHPADSINEFFHGSLSGETCTISTSVWEKEFPASVLKSALKYGKKQIPVDENKRDTYRFSLPSNHGHSPLSPFEGEWMQLVEGDAFMEHGYARSLTRFAKDLGPFVWKVASKKIESVLPVVLHCDPGWGGENVKSVYYNPASNDHLSRLSSEPVFLQGREDVETSRVLNTRSELASRDSNVGGIRSVHSFQVQQNPMARPCIDGSYIQPQMGMSRLPTSATHSEMIEMVPSLNEINSNEARLLETSRRSDSVYGLEINQHKEGYVQLGWPYLHQQQQQPQPDLALKLRMGR
ncbi:hypothetical protein UlMin_033924 [Ulmus minor]